MEQNKSNRGFLALCLALAAATLLSFGPVLHNQFINYDDRDYVLANRAVTSGLSWAGLAWAWGVGYASNFHPLTWMSHMLDVQLFGLRPAGHHLSSLLLHLANSLLLFWLLQRLSGARWRSWLVAALFALHPLHVQSVAWVAERKDVLSGFFFLLTLLAYSAYARLPSPSQPPWRRPLCYGLALGLFGLGLLSKPMLVTLPFVLVLLDFWPLGRLALPPQPQASRACWIAVLREKIPFLLLAALASALTLAAQSRSIQPLEAVPLGLRAANAPIACVHYLAQMCWPTRLSFFYPLPNHWPLALALGAGLLLAGLSGLCLAQARRRPFLLVGWLWFVGMLVPVIGLVQVGDQAQADRYTYLPLIGLFLGLVWLLPQGPTRWSGARPLLWGAAALALLGCAGLSWKECHHWRSSRTLCQRALELNPQNALAHLNLSAYLLESGAFAEAQPHLQAALKLGRPYIQAMALTDLGICEQRQRHFPEATAYLEKALGLSPSATAYTTLGDICLSQAQLPQAEAHYQRALRLDPTQVEAWVCVAYIKASQGQHLAAFQAYGTALRFEPTRQDIRLRLAGELLALQRFEEAIAQFSLGLRASPPNATAQAGLALALASRGEFAAAQLHYAEACRLEPLNLEARRGLGLALFYQGKLAEALEHFDQLQRSQPDAKTQYHQALALEGLGRFQEALAHSQEAVRLAPKSALYLSQLAWLLATEPKATQEQAAYALQLAQQACQLDASQNPRLLRALEVAYGALGRFEEAGAKAQAQLLQAQAQKDQPLVRALQERLALYQAKKPFERPAALAPPH